MNKLVDKGDLISRSALIAGLTSDPIGSIIAERYNLDGWIEGFPAADIEGRKSGWILKNNAYRCERCGFRSDQFPSEKGWKYCPGCGSMVGHMII